MKRALGWVALGLAAALSGGCFLALAVFPPPLSAASAAPGGPPVLEGVVRIGKAGGAATLSPLTASAGLASSSLLPATAQSGLGDVPPVEVASASESVLAGGAADGVTVEAVDLADGSRLGAAKADGAGSYRIPLASAASRRALAIQATTVAGGKVSAFLAAPCTVPAGTPGKLRIDVTPGTSVVALAYARLSGVTAELAVDKGFRGFKTAKLGALVAALDGTTAGAAAATLDGSDTFSKATSFDSLLNRVVAGATALAQATVEKAGAVAADTPTHAATVPLILAKATTLQPTAAARPQDIVLTAAVTVGAAAIRNAKAATPAP